ncbi:DUF4253 domain-containing protein [Streptomyces sp. KHY 26]|uniref:DUF4253 domain-containing protein n=1 Tax=Streptomyces sp. KHY 26 TaxID=3097359 RepID=UPI00376EC659
MEPVPDPVGWWTRCQGAREETGRGPGVEPWDEDPGAPFDRWPGLAAGITSLAGADPDAAARTAVSRLVTGPYPPPTPHLALVPAARCADVPAVMGRQAEAPLPLLCALLRSWEDRFGAPVVAFDGAMIHVSVARPPRDADHANRLALEHVLTGADNINDGTVPCPDHAASLLDSPLWSFWWDSRSSKQDRCRAGWRRRSADGRARRTEGGRGRRCREVPARPNVQTAQVARGGRPRR